MWKTVLKSRQRTAVDKNTKMGQREIICGLGASGCSSIALNILEFR